ncbi:MAG: hypothetical protein JXR07_15280 [Reichenbachiella sp.]
MINELRRSEVRAFIKAHEKEDPAALVLKYGDKKNLPIQLIAAQIKARQKAKSKLPFFYKNDLIFPHGVSLEQCSSEDTAQYKSSIFKGKNLTDLTGGFGIDTYFLSQNFDVVNYVEKNKELVALAESNFKALNTKIRTHHLEAEAYLNKTNIYSDSFFIDPARRDGTNQKVFRIEECQPNLKILLPQILKNKSQILVKLSPMLDIYQALNELPNVSEIHVVSVQNECKELIFKLDPIFEDSPKIFTVNIKGSISETFSFHQLDEKKTPEFDFPKKYIYEPNASIMKAGGFNAVAHQYGLSKLHPNTHLYTSERYLTDFPGRKFKLKIIESLNKKKLQSHLNDKKANITIRNFPSTVKAIRQKTGIKEGSDTYLFATTLKDDALKVLICQKMG